MMRKLVSAAAVGSFALLALPVMAVAQEPGADGWTCDYAQSGGEIRVVDSDDADGNAANGNQEVVVYAGSGGTTGTADSVAGVCVSDPQHGATAETGAGDNPDGRLGSYAVVDGHSQNGGHWLIAPDGYWGVSNYETDGNNRTTESFCEWYGANRGGGGTGSNSGGCVSYGGGLVAVYIPPDVPSPVCGGAGGFSDGNTWNSSSRDGCDPTPDIFH